MLGNITIKRNKDTSYDIELRYSKNDIEVGRDFFAAPDDKLTIELAKYIREVLQKHNDIDMKNLNIYIMGVVIAKVPISQVLAPGVEDYISLPAVKYSGCFIKDDYADIIVETIKDTCGGINVISPNNIKINSQGIVQFVNINDQLVEQMHLMGVKVVPNFCAGQSRELSENCLINLEETAGQLLNGLRLTKVDGINLKLQNLSPAFKDRYVLLTKILRENIAGDGEISVTVPANPNGYKIGHFGATCYTDLSCYTDHLCVEVFDAQNVGVTPKPIAPINFVKSALDYAVKECKPISVVAVLPMFGRIWSESGRILGWQITLDNIRQIINQFSVNYYYDKENASPFFTFTVLKKVYFDFELIPGNYTVWYENEQSLKAKLELVNSYGLKGCMLSDIGGEAHSLWKNYSSWLDGSKRKIAFTHDNSADAVSTNSTEETEETGTQIDRTDYLTDDYNNQINQNYSIEIQREELNLKNMLSDNLDDEKTLQMNTSKNIYTYGQTSADKIHVYSGPQTYYTLLDVLSSDQIVYVTERFQNGYYKIKLKSGIVGYVNTKFINLGKAVKATAALKARLDPDYRTKIEFTIEKNSNLYLLNNLGVFSKVLYNNYVVYVSSVFLK